jgi:hypothetical protein
MILPGKLSKPKEMTIQREAVKKSLWKMMVLVLISLKNIVFIHHEVKWILHLFRITSEPSKKFEVLHH